MSTAVGMSLKSHRHPQTNAVACSPAALVTGFVLQMPKYPGLEQAKPLQTLVAPPR